MSGQAMMLFGFPAIVGVTAGYASGGRLGGLVATRLRALWLVWLAGAMQMAEYTTSRIDGRPGQALRSVLLATAFVTVLGWLLVNLRGRSRLLKTAASTALAGGLLNGMAIALNGRMPYSPAAAAAAGIPPGQETAKNIAAAHGSRLTLLGDFIPVPPVHAVISIGDILITLGAAVVIATAMHQPTPQHIKEARNDSNQQRTAPDDSAVHCGDLRPTSLHHRSPRLDRRLRPHPERRPT
ncbi:DUF5317 family protein [Streptomyces sp. YS-3]|uniref:DUF5317 family protein n=1 Tax=Streptomyces sp. YS-3 TaxID=3381352 RepID=UPI0038628CEB